MRSAPAHAGLAACDALVHGSTWHNSRGAGAALYARYLSKCCLMGVRLQPARASEAERALAYAVMQRPPVAGLLARAQVFRQHRDLARFAHHDQRVDIEIRR